MGISLTNILAGAGISTAANALFPGAGMADAFVRSAGMGLGNGLMRTAVTPNRPGGSPNRMGGPGSPEGAMPTRRFGSTKETVGELKSGFKDWLVDPLQAKKEKKEAARDTALAVRLGITGGEYSLTHRSAMSLIKKRSGDVQTNIMILQFRVQQFMARNLSAIASTLGVSRSKLGHEEADPSRTWFGKLMSSMAEDIKKIPGVSGTISLGKHILNIARFLNPLTAASRIGKGAKSFAELLQRLALGKEGFETMKDPTKIAEKAGLKQDFQTTAVNLLKVNNEYQQRQLNMLFNLVVIGEKILGLSGVKHKRVELDIAHDEYDGKLKTKAEAKLQERLRNDEYDFHYNKAFSGGIAGFAANLVSGASTTIKKAYSGIRRRKATGRDKQVFSLLLDKNPDALRGVTRYLDRFLDQHPNFDVYGDQAAADQFKTYLHASLDDDLNGLPPNEIRARMAKQASLRRLYASYDKITSASSRTQRAQVFGTALSNPLGFLTGNYMPDVRAGEHTNRVNASRRYGFGSRMPEILAGSADRNQIENQMNTSIVRKAMRGLSSLIPVIGPILFGLGEQHQRASLSTHVAEELHRPMESTNIDTASMGMGKESNPDDILNSTTGFVGPSFMLHKFGLDAEIQMYGFFDRFLDNLIDRRQKVSIYNITKDTCDKLESLEFRSVVTGIGNGAITSLTSEVYDVNLVGVDSQKLLPSIKPIIDDFINKLGNGAATLINNDFKNVLVGPGGLVETFFSRVKNWVNGNTDEAFPIVDEDQSKANRLKTIDINIDKIANSGHFANGGVLSGGNISNYSNKIVTQPTLFNYDDLHKFANGAGLMGEAGAEAVVPLERGKDGKLGVNTTGEMPVVDTKSGVSSVQSAISAIMVDEKGKPIDFDAISKITGDPKPKIIREIVLDSIIAATNQESVVSKIAGKFSGLTGSVNSEDDNVKTAAEREKDVEEKKEKEEQEKKEEKQQENEEEKKTLLQKISDFLDPSSKINKLRELLKKKKDSKFSLSSLWENTPGLLKKLGIGALAGFIYSQFSEQINKFLMDTVGSAFNSIVAYLQKNGPSMLGAAWQHFTEHPFLDAAIFTSLFPGFVGSALSKIALPLITKMPLSLPLVIGMGGMVYNLIDAFSHSKDEKGGFSVGGFLKEFFLGSDGGIGGTLSKAASFGWMGAKIGAMFGAGAGAIPGMMIGAAIGALVGSTNSRDENGNFSWSQFFKNLAFGNNASGGLANGATQFLKWGLVGGAIGGPLGFLLGGSIGSLLGVIGSDKFAKFYKFGEESGRTVAKFFKWESGSFAYKAATNPVANAIPYLGAFIFGALGSILDLGGMLIKGIWGTIKSYLPQSVVDKIEGNQSEYAKKFDEKNKFEVSYSEKDADVTGQIFDREYKMNVNEKDAAYINAAETDYEKRKRYQEIEKKNNRKKAWGTEATTGVGPDKKKYDPEKYIALKEKWAEEDRKRKEIEGHEIDVPVLAPGVKDFSTTLENAKRYQELFDENESDAVEFARAIYQQQQAEEKKREAERANQLSKIEIKVGSSPEDLKLDAQRKSSSAPAAMAAMGVGGPNRIKINNSRLRDVVKRRNEPSGKIPSPNSAPAAADKAAKDSAEKAKEKEKLSRRDATPETPSPNPAPTADDKTSTEVAARIKAGKAALASAGTAGTIAAATALTTQQTPQATPAPTPDAAQAPGAAQQPAQPGSGAGLNWIENLISQTIQGAFKIGGSVAGAVQNMNNGGGQSSNIGLSGSTPSGDPRLDDIGWLSSSRESKGDRSLVAYDKDGGTSYGKYQFASKRGSESMVDFLKWAAKTQGEPGKKLHDFMAQSVGGDLYRLNTGSKTGAPVDAWKKAVADGLVGDMDEKYMRYRFHDKALNNLSPDVQKLVNSSKTLSQVLVSTAVQHGENKAQGKGAPWVFEHAYKPGISIEEFIKNVYEERKRAYHGQYQRAVYNRYDEEVQQALSLYGVEKKIASGGGSMAVNGGVPSGPLPNASPAVQKYLAIMERNTHGARYEMSGRRDNPGIYDCSSFVSRSLREAGYRIPSPSPTTAELGSTLKANGFQYYPLRMNEGLTRAPAQLQPGDILLNRGNGWHNHVETYWGNNKMVGAHSSTSGVSVKSFYSTGYPGFYRLPSGAGSSKEDLIPNTGSANQNYDRTPYGMDDQGKLQDLSKELGSVDFSWPTVSPVINSPFGRRDPKQYPGAKGKISENHGGIDIKASKGAPVFSAMPGIVSGTTSKYGMIEVQHPHGLSSRYLHLGRFAVKGGDRVKAGQFIGEAGGIGKTGTEEFNPHLHFETLKDQRPVDPTFVAKNGSSKNHQLKGSAVGGPEFAPRINKKMNEYFGDSGVGGPEISVKSDNRVIAELKKLQVIMMGVMKAAGKPSIAVSAPQQSGGGNPQNQVDESGASDAFTDSAFSQIGGLLPNLNVSMTGLGTSIA